MSPVTAPLAPPSRLSSVISLWLAVIVFAAAGSVVQLLTQLGARNPVDGNNPISFCNILFVGNLVAFFVFSVIYRKQYALTVIKKLKLRDWFAVFVSACISASLAPSLVFLALERTDVVNVVLLGRIEPVIFIFLAAFFLNELPNRWSVLAMVLTFTGVAVALSWQTMGNYKNLGTGEVMAIAAACISAASSILSKIWLKRIPAGLFLMVRTGLGAIIFFWVAVYLFGFDHFQDAFSPFVWKWTTVYVLIIIVTGQILWFKGLKTCAANTVAMAGTFHPIAAMGFAILLLNSTLSPPILIGCVFFLAAFLFLAFGVWKTRDIPLSQSNLESVGKSDLRDSALGFKGI